MPALFAPGRALALTLLLAALWVPCAGASAATHPCCPAKATSGAAPPCHSDSAPCASLAAAPCCDVAPASAWPTAQRESAPPAPTACARALHVAPAAPLFLLTPEVASAPNSSPLRLSVVLRN